MVAAPPSDASRGGGPPEKAGVKSPSLASESDYNGSEIEPEPWEVLETLRAENERLRADLAALRREGAREEPTSGTASAPMAPVAAGDGPLKNFGKDGPGAPGKLSDAATLPESSVLEPPTVRVTLAPYATALIRQAITTIVFNGNVPLTIPQIVSAVRKRVNAAGTSEDLGVTFETDPTATMGAAIRAFVLKTKSEHHPPLFVRIREGGKSRFFIDMVPAAVAQGSLVEVG